MTLIKAWREKKTRFLSGSNFLFGFHFMFSCLKLSHTSIFTVAEGKKKLSYCFFSAVHAGFPDHRIIAQLDFVGGDPIPATIKTTGISISFALTEWNRFYSSKNFPDFNPDTTWPPDGVSALQDDSSEEGEVDGVHLEPLVPVLIHGTPGSIVHIPVFNARLKTQVTQEGFFFWGGR